MLSKPSGSGRLHLHLLLRIADGFRVARNFQLRLIMKKEPWKLAFEGFRREVSQLWFCEGR
jgi:hypothetical protein